MAISGARGLFEAHGNRATPGTVHVRVLPPIRTAGMSRAEQKQLPTPSARPFWQSYNFFGGHCLMASYRYERDIDPKDHCPPQGKTVHPQGALGQLVGL